MFLLLSTGTTHHPTHDPCQWNISFFSLSLFNAVTIDGNSRILNGNVIFEIIRNSTCILLLLFFFLQYSLVTRDRTSNDTEYSPSVDFLKIIGSNSQLIAEYTFLFHHNKQINQYCFCVGKTISFNGTTSIMIIKGQLNCFEQNRLESISFASLLCDGAEMQHADGGENMLCVAIDHFARRNSRWILGR